MGFKEGAGGGGGGGGTPNLAAVLTAGNTASNKITGLTAASDPSDAVRFDQLPSEDVTSVFGRTGDVVAASGDYNDGEVTNSPTNILTTTGDLLYASAAKTLARLGIGVLGQIVRMNTAGTLPVWGQIPFLQYQEHTASGSAGGATSAGAWTICPLNTEVTDTDGIGSLSTNEVTLPAGTYYVEGSQPLSNAGLCKLRIQNISDSATLIDGQNGQDAESNTVVTPIVAGQFTLAASKIIALQYWVANAASDGLGRAVTSGDIEIYGDLRIWKVG